MVKKKSTQKPFSNKLAVGYSLIALWMLLLAVTDYPSQLSSFHTFLGQERPPVPDLLILLLFLGPVVLLAIPLAYLRLRITDKQNLTLSMYVQMLISIFVIVVCARFEFFLLNILTHGLF
jgi:hypothetical protein